MLSLKRLLKRVPIKSAQIAAPPTFSTSTARTQRRPLPTCTRARLTVPPSMFPLCCHAACSRPSRLWPDEAPTSTLGPRMALLVEDAVRAASMAQADITLGVALIVAALHRLAATAHDLLPIKLPNALALVPPSGRPLVGPAVGVVNTDSAAGRTIPTRLGPSRPLRDEGAVAVGSTMVLVDVAAATTATPAATDPSAPVAATVDRR